MLGSILIISVLTVVAVVAWRTINWLWIQPKRMEKILRSQGFKGNPYRFFYGDAWETKIMYKESYSKPIGLNDDILPRIMPFIYKTIRTYGEKSFMWVEVRPMVFITDPELMKVVMNKYTSFQKSFKISNPVVRNVIGGLIRFEGEKWSQSRKKLMPVFHPDKLKERGRWNTLQGSGLKYLAPYIEVALVEYFKYRKHKCNAEAVCMDEWSDKVPKDGSPVTFDVYPYLPDFTASVVSNILFSVPYEDAIVKRTFLLVNELMLVSNQAQPFSIPGEQYFPSERYRRANAIENELTSIFTNMINARLTKRQRGENNGEPDLFDLFLDELNEVDIKDGNARAMVMHEIVQQCKLFYTGGHETTAFLLAWTMVLLGFHQEWQERAREEAFQVLGNKNEVDSDGLAQLKILNMILHEVLRLYPPSVEVSRVVEEEMPLGDFCLPKGTMLMLPVAILHRNPDIWGKDVMEFKPDRFAKGTLKAANGHAALIPFGWGVRNCIGENMALMEAKVFFALCLRRFSFELSPTYEHGPFVSLNMLPQYGIPLILRKL